MKKMNKKYLAVFMTLCILVSGWQLQTERTQAATFSDINQDSVFLKQPSGSSLCTLVAATMLVRRGAMMNGNTNWASITTDVMRSAAWVEGTGLKWNFTCGGMTVVHDSFSGSTADLAVKLSEHPEGIVVYKQKSDQQHAVLVTDYTDGAFYCADPAAGIFAGRIPISSASIGIEEANYIWYVSSPALYLTDASGNQIPHVVETPKPSTSSPKPTATATAKPTSTAKPKATATTKPKTTKKPKATAKATAKPKATEKAESADKTSEKVTAPGKVSGVSVKNKKKKTLTITWKSTKGAKGYQVRFATTKKIPKGAAYVNLTGHRAALTDLSKGSVFYVKVRAYKLNGKKKVFGPYSGVKKGKVKK